MGVKGGLQAGDLATVGNVLDGFDLTLIGLDGQYQAASNNFTVKADGTRSANAMFATDASSFQAQFVTQIINQMHARTDGAFFEHPVDFDSCFNLIIHGCIP